MRKLLLTSGSLIALGAFALPSIAQEAPSAEDEARQDVVIVTATRRAESVQDIPLNIAAVGGPEIEQQGLDELADLIAYVPGINIVDRGPRQGNPIVVRGLNATPIGSGDGNNDGGGTVATYLGEVPLFIDLKLNDLERVEVLLGPQGTLYGAGTLAGAIRYIPAKPKFDEDTFEVRSELYQYSEAEDFSYDVGFTFNKQFGDNFAIRGSLDYLDDSGFVDQPFLLQELGVSNPDPDFTDAAAVAANLRSAEDVDTEEALSGRIAARWSPTDRIDGTLTYYFQDVEVGGRRISSARAVYPGAGPEIFTAGDFDNAKRIPEPNTINNELLALEVTADLGFAELTSATGFSRFEDEGNRDQNDLLISLEYSYELFPAFASQTLEVGETETFTQEVRLVSTIDSPISYIAGYFYSKQDSGSFSAEVTPGYAQFAGFDRPDNLEYFSQGYTELEEAALYGEVTYQVTDKLSITGGLRYYEYDLKEFSAVDFPLFDPDFVAPSLSQIIGSDFNQPGQADDGFLYKFNASYDVTNDLLVYATVSQGFRIGNSNGLGPCPDFDPDATQGSCALAPGQQFGPNPDDIAQFDERAFGPDETTNYEIGTKTTWLDGALTLNGAIFYVDWTDPQLSSATVNANIPITVNAGGAESVGVELQGSWRVTSNFDVRGSFSYTQSELTEDVPFLVRTISTPGFGTAFEDGEAGDRLPGSPETQFAVFGNYVLPLSNGNEVFLNGGYTYQSDVLTRAGGRGSSVTLDGFGIANIAGGYQTDNWSAQLYVSNVFDEYIETGFVGTPLSNQIVQDTNGDPVTVRTHYATLGAPRTVGVRFAYKFGGS